MTTLGATASTVTFPATAADVGAQSSDATLTALAGLATGADKLPYSTGTDTFSQTDLTTAARTVLDDTTVGAMVDTLGGASSTGTGGLVRATSPTLVTPALGTPASGVATNLTGTAAGLTAGTVTTNANLTGPITSVGNATTVAQSLFPNYGATGILAENIPRNILLGVNSTVMLSGRLQMEIIYLRAGITVTNIIFSSQTTAAVNPSHWMFGLFDSSRNLLANSTDQTSTAWAANTIKTVAMSSAYPVTTSGLYYCGMFMVADTVPTFMGHTNASSTLLRNVAPIIGGTSTTGLTTAMPNPAAAITVGTACLYCAVS